MVAIGVLNSCVMLFIKSVLISDIFFCLINWNKELEKAIIIIKIKNKESNKILEIPDKICSFSLGKEIFK